MINSQLINYLKQSIELLNQSKSYQWGHSGHCNCGHLAQVMTGKTYSELLKISQVREGDWSQQAEMYCDNSGIEIDNVIGLMLKSGLNIEDIEHIEYLSNPAILEKLPGGKKFLLRNSKENVILYFQGWISLLEEMQTNNQAWDVKSTEVESEIVIYDSIPEQVF